MARLHIIVTAFLLLTMPVAVAEPGERSEGGEDGFRLRMVYLAKRYPDPLPLSLVEKPITDRGIQGARLALKEARHIGRFLGQRYELEEVFVAEDAEVAERARALLAEGRRLFVLDLDAADLLAVADLPQAAGAVFLNIRALDDFLRVEACRPNVFHVAPSYAMLADALAQFLVWKRWYRWLVIHGVAESDRAFMEALERAAKRFAGKIVEVREYEFRVGSRRVDSGYQQIQTQMPLFTVGAPAHDVLWVVDTTEAFGLYLPYNTTDPAPVVGSFGLVPRVWHRSYEFYAGMQFQEAFDGFAGRHATERDYLGWLAVRILVEAALRTGRTDAATVRDYLRSDRFIVGAYKGVGLTFRLWNQQLRHRILLAWARSTVSLSPQDKFLHQRNPLDTLGYDRPESRCRLDGQEE